MTDKNGDGTFVRVTNKVIYTKLLDIEKLGIQTNGSVKTNRTLINWLWAILSTMVFSLIGLAIKVI